MQTAKIIILSEERAKRRERREDLVTECTRLWLVWLGMIVGSV